MFRVSLQRVVARRFCSQETVKPVKLPVKTKIYNYFKNIVDDYKLVAQETVQDIKDQPLKTCVILSTLGVCVYCCKTNPTEESFHEQLLTNTNELLCLGDAIRNKYCDLYMQRITEAYNAGCMRRLTFGLFSIMWIDNYSKETDLFDARCKSIKVGWLDLPERIVDIGFSGKWLYLSKSMDNYDINPNEWGEKEERIYPTGISKDIHNL